MEITGEHFVKAPRELVWQALNDPVVLRGAIPGCQAMTSSAPDNFEATVRISVGPIKATFLRSVLLQDIDPPNSYRIIGEGKGGAADFAKGKARVHLEPDGDGTRVKYFVSAQVGGKLAQIGGRLIERTARKVAKELFESFSGLLTARIDASADAEPTVSGALSAVERHSLLSSVTIPLAAVFVAAIVIWSVVRALVL